MAASPDWDAVEVIKKAPAKPFHGRVWRAHHRSYEALDHGGSLRSTGRYHRARDRFEGETWSALYLSLSREVCVGEVVRRSGVDLRSLNEHVLTEIEVVIEEILDLRQAEALGVAPEALLDDYNFELPQSLAAAARSARYEGLLVPSATCLGDNLIVFPDLLRPTSRLTPISTSEMRLFVQHELGP